MRIVNVFFVAVCCLPILVACNNSAGHSDLSVAEFENAIAQRDIQILDVRTPDEYSSGHLTNAFLANWNNTSEFESRVKALDKNKPVYTYCLSGGRSNAATQWLIENGFTAYNLAGGIIAWKRAGKPLEEAVMAKQITLAEYMAQIPTDKTVLVDFSAVWCPPCKKMTPVLDSLVITNGSQFILVKIDGGQQTEICQQLQVSAYPTFIIYKQGKETWRKDGVVEAKELISNF